MRHALIGAALLMLFGTGSAVAQQAMVCLPGEPEKAMERWAERTGEKPLANFVLNLGPYGQLPAVLTVGETGEMTILFSRPTDGALCLFVTGDGFAKAAPIPDPGSDL